MKFTKSFRTSLNKIQTRGLYTVILPLSLIFFLIPGLGFSQFSQEKNVKVFAELTTGTTVISGRTILKVTFDFPNGFHQSLQKEFFNISLLENDTFALGEIVYPEGVIKDGSVAYYGQTTLQAPVIVKDFSRKQPGPAELQITTSYQLCDEGGTCFLPEKEKIVLSAEIAAVPSNLINILKFILLAFAGGIILNVMPCVLPLLSVRALSLVRESQNDKGKIFLNSMAYTGGILFSFLVLALIVTVIKKSGELVGWGFQFQNPGFVITLTAVIYVFALAMFDLYVITAPGLNAAAKASGRGGYTGSFLTGVFAVLVATPCTAPFLGSALGFAFSQSPVVIFLIFIFVGIGLALPFILLGIWPSIIKRIPRPGPWMNTFKEIMGFLLIGTAIYLLNTLYHQIGGNIIRVIVFLAFLTFAAWVYGKFARPGVSRRKHLFVLLFITGVAFASGWVTLVFPKENAEMNNKAGNEIKTGWEIFDPALLEKYRSEGYPVFIDFYAEWCTNCKLNEARVLGTEDVKDIFRKNNTKLLLGDFTLNDPLIAEWIQKFGKGGVPVYALYLPGSTEPVIFPEILSKKMISDAFLSR